MLREHNQQETPTGLAINLSTQSLTHGDLSRYITDCLVEFDIDPRAVIFEITESGALNHLDAVRHLIQELKPFGCRLRSTISASASPRSRISNTSTSIS